MENKDKLVTAEGVKALYEAIIDSPSFTGIPVAPTPEIGTSTTQIATTAFVKTCVSEALANTETTTDDIRTYTVNIPLDGTSAITYSDDASSMTAGSSDWDDMPIFARIKPCIFKDGEVVYYLDKDNFNLREDGITASDLTGADGDVMIEIPAFAYKISQTSSILTVSVTNDISDALSNGYTVRAFTYESSGDCSAYYIGAYLGASDDTYGISSLPNKTPLVSTQRDTYIYTIDQKRNDAHYGLVSYFIITALQCLYLIKYADRDGQTALGNGMVNTGTSTIITGGTESLGMDYGTTNNQTTHMKLFGVEDFWGGLWQMTSDVTIEKVATIGDAMTITVGSDTITGDNYTTWSWGQYISSIYGNNDLGFLFRTVSSSSGIFTDGGGLTHPSSDQSHFIAIGGAYDSETLAGPFAAQTIRQYTTAEYTGGRLGYKKVGTYATDTKTVPIARDTYLVSPDGTYYKLTIDDDGAVSLLKEDSTTISISSDIEAAADSDITALFS